MESAERAASSPNGRHRPAAFRRLGGPAVALSLALGAAQVAAAVPSQAATTTGGTARVAVGKAPSLPKGSAATAAPSSSTKIKIDVELNTGHAAELQAYASAVGNRNSPFYHRYLTPAEVTANFGASAAEVDAVDAQLKAEGLTPGAVSGEGMFIPVTATVGQAEQAFGVSIKGYRASGRNFYANSTAPTVPGSISGYVSGLVGLDTVSYAVPEYKTSHRAVKAPSVVTKATTKTRSSVTANDSVGNCASAVSWLGTNYGAVNGRDFYTAGSLASIYGLSSVPSSGAGVTVAVFELESYDAAGVADFGSCYGTTGTVSEVAVDGGATAQANMYTGEGIESALDIETIATLAPAANVIDYEGPDAANATDANLLDTYSAITTADKAQVISTSWGLCEALSAHATVASENTIFQTAATQGQTVVAASGDYGSATCFPSGADTSTVDAQDPSSQPFVLGVGGTTMTGLSSPPQTVWNHTLTVSGTTYGGASGGGLSTIWSAPTYQAGDEGPGYNKCATASTTGCRQVPDVSAVADPFDGYIIEEYSDDGLGDVGEQYNIIGGTSGAAPLWAAIYALADSSASCKANGNAGFTNTALYAAANSMAGYSVFTDVTSGNNWLPETSAPYGYGATNGYDMASGLGTPKAAGVVATVCKAGLVSAASYYVADGPTRVLDTRNGTGGTTGPIASGGTVKLQIAGNTTAGVPSSNITAVVLNLTVTNSAQAGVATAYPDGTTLPASSNLNWVPGETVPNLVVVPVGTDGAIDIWNGSPKSSAQFVGDIEGYFTSDSAATGDSTYTAVGPVRAVDTRTGVGLATGKVTAGKPEGATVGGATIGSVTIPAGITAVAMNVTVTNTTTAGFLTVYPNETGSGTGVSVPNASNVNYGKGATVANMVIVPVGADGKVDFAVGGTTTGATDVVADISGYFSPGTNGEKYHALGPDRILDTRIALGNSGVTPIAGNGTLGLPLPAGATAVITNLTITGGTSNGYLTAYPTGGTLPNASNVNFAKGQNIPNLAIVPSNSGVEFHNAGTGSTDLVVDLAGYFSAS